MGSGSSKNSYQVSPWRASNVYGQLQAHGEANKRLRSNGFSPEGNSHAAIKKAQSNGLLSDATANRMKKANHNGNIGKHHW